MSAHWYTLHVKPHRENSVHKLLLSRESVSYLGDVFDPAQTFDVYFPSIQVKPVNPRSAKIQPFFPGYLFVYVDLDEVGPHALNRIPGTHRLVSFGDEPAVVPDHLITALKQHVSVLAEANSSDKSKFQKGDQVRIVTGPFAGYEAIFDERLAGTERVQVLLTFLSMQPKKLKLDPEAIEVLKKK